MLEMIPMGHRSFWTLNLQFKLPHEFLVNLRDKFLHIGDSYLTAIEFKLVKTNSLAAESGNLSITSFY